MLIGRGMNKRRHRAFGEEARKHSRTRGVWWSAPLEQRGRVVQATDALDGEVKNSALSQEPGQDLGARRPVPPAVGDADERAHVPEREAYADLVSLTVREQIELCRALRLLADRNREVEHDLFVEPLNDRKSHEEEVVLRLAIPDLDRDRLGAVWIRWIPVAEVEGVRRVRRIRCVRHDRPFSSSRGVLMTRLCCR